MQEIIDQKYYINFTRGVYCTTRYDIHMVLVQFTNMVCILDHFVNKLIANIGNTYFVFIKTQNNAKVKLVLVVQNTLSSNTAAHIVTV